MNAPKVLKAGTGEWTIGFVHGPESSSDKEAGVVALTWIDLKSKERTGELLMAGANGTRIPAIREHLDRVIGQRYLGLDTGFRSSPADVPRDSDAWQEALVELSPGDVVSVFTPDDTHHAIALAALKKALGPDLCRCA